ncbi:MAG: flagellar hook-length control protein FliK [Bacteriovoracaceae bacterium]|nr:flagellar hook-length control protein FliK [Bacteriovoracaceae bacterium]
MTQITSANIQTDTSSSSPTAKKISSLAHQSQMKKKDSFFNPSEELDSNNFLMAMMSQSPSGSADVKSSLDKNNSFDSSQKILSQLMSRLNGASDVITQEVNEVSDRADSNSPDDMRLKLGAHTLKNSQLMNSLNSQHGHLSTDDMLSLKNKFAHSNAHHMGRPLSEQNHSYSQMDSQGVNSRNSFLGKTKKITSLKNGDFQINPRPSMIVDNKLSLNPMLGNNSQYQNQDSNLSDRGQISLINHKNSSNLSELTATIKNYIVKQNMAQRLEKLDFHVDHSTLGKIDISVSKMESAQLGNDTFEIKLSPSNLATQQLLMENRGELQNQLKLAGIHTSDIKVEQNSSLNSLSFDRSIAQLSDPSQVKDLAQNASAGFSSQSNSNSQSQSQSQFQNHSSPSESSWMSDLLGNENSKSSQSYGGSEGRERRDEMWNILNEKRRSYA